MIEKPGKRHLLVIENPDKSGMRVAAELAKFPGPVRIPVTTVSDMPTVRRVLKSQAVAAVIIEVGRETGETLALLRLLGKGNQGIPIYVYNGFMLPRIAEKCLEYSQVHYCEDHQSLAPFLEGILAEVSRKRRGIIHDISLDNFLRMMNSEKFNGRITVTAGEKRGVLVLHKGQLIRANLNGLDDDLALAEMSSWEKVTVELEEKPSAPDPSTRPALKSEEQGKRNGSAVSSAAPTRTGHIEILHFHHQGRRISININRLNSALLEIQELLAKELVRTDIFLSKDGRSLAGWNSHPLACSAFAAITESLRNSLPASNFPPLGKYYLLDLADEHLLLIFIRPAMQWGLLLKGSKERLGLLINILMPKAIQALADAVTEQNSA